MTDQERYLFDLQGFLVVPNALSEEELDELNSIMDEHIANETESNMRTHRFGKLLNWGKAYLNLIDNLRIVPYLEALLGSNFRLDHDYADIIRAGKGPIGTTLHGGAMPFNPTFYYKYDNGRMHNGLTLLGGSIL